MMDNEYLEIVRRILKNVFDCDNKLGLEGVLEKFAFDIKIPRKVYDSTTGDVTWSDSFNGEKFITLSNMEKRDKEIGWMIERKRVNDFGSLIKIWESINFITTERVYDSLNVFGSDTIYRCENIYRCSNCSDGKSFIYCDSCGNSEYLIGSQRSYDCNWCIRCDDSVSCSNSYSVVCSNKIVNSFFIQDCFDLYECMFCSHISSRKFCIANMQFEEEEYYKIKKLVTEWIINS